MIPFKIETPVGLGSFVSIIFDMQKLFLRIFCLIVSSEHGRYGYGGG